MFRQFMALLWLRCQIILSNKSILLQVLMPAVLIYLYRFMIDSQSGPKAQMALAYLMICIPFAIVLAVGNPILTILADEKEKKTLKTLLLSGVNTSEYLLSTLVVPIVLTVVYLTLTPLILDVPIDHLVNYCLVGSATALVIALLYLLLGLLVKSQVMAQVVAVPTMLISAFLPMLSGMDKTVAKVTDYSFMGLFTKFFTKWEKFSWHHATLQILSLFIWLLVLLILIVTVARQQKKS